MMVDLTSLVIFDPTTATLYSASDLPMVMNGNALQLTLPSSSLTDRDMGIGLVAKGERKVVRKTSAAVRRSRKNLSKALREANARLRKKNGQLKKGKTQADVMRLAQRLKKKM